MVRISLLAGVALMAMAAGAAWPAHAGEWVTAAQLARACSGHSPTDEHDCDGYLAGVLDTMAAAPSLSNGVCPPAHTKLGALREALGRFAQQRPEAARGSSLELVQGMIKTNYPCPAQ